MKKEKLALAFALLNFDNLLETESMIKQKYVTEQEIDKVRLKKDDIIKKMIKYIEHQAGNKHSEKNLKDLLEVFSLMVNQSSSKRREIQDIFNSNRATEMVLQLLSSNQQYEATFFNSLMNFCNAMLSGKNKKVQKTIFKYFKIYRQTEKTFSRLSVSITEFTVRLKEGARRSPQFTQSILTCSEVLRFIVLCCEGHYTEMQNYFRTQSNLAVQHNFLKEIVDLMSALASNLSKDLFEPMMLAFDALIELVQGPNRPNQDFLLKGPILELLSNLLMHTGGQQKTKMVQGKEDLLTRELSVWETRRMKYKVITLLQGLCELTDNPTRVFGRFSKFFPIFLMLIYLEECYMDYKRVYGTQELVLHSLNKVVSDNSSTTKHKMISTSQ